MPDPHGFEHLRWHGEIFHRCVEEGCEWPGYGVNVPEAARKRHHDAHVRDRRKQARRAQEQALAKGRRLLAAQRRENEAAYDEGDT
jgi:hypothetical protein